jgi:hypothetical protein
MDKQLTDYLVATYNDPVVEQKTCPYTGTMFAVHQSYQDLLEKVSPTIAGKKRTYTIPTISPEVRERMRTMFRNERIYTNNVSAKS